MARALTPTLLGLDRWAQILGLHPLNFNQVTVQSLAPDVNSVHPLYQYSWQKADAVSREEIAMAIAGVEELICQQLGYDVSPRWNEGLNGEGERIDWGDPLRNWHYQLRAKRGYMITGGQRAKTLIDDNVAVVYSDEDSDGYKETATISVATTVTDSSEIAIYYPGEDGDDGWKIPTKRVSISSGTATIVTRREYLVAKNLIEALAPDTVNGLDDPSFLDEVDVYRVYNDPSRQVEFYWRNEGGCNYCTSGCVQCGLTVQTGCMAITNSRLGLFSPRAGNWDADNNRFDYVAYSVCGRLPNYVRLWYKAGLVQMPLRWEEAIAYFSLSRLDRPLSGIEHIYGNWAADFRRSIGTAAQTKNYQISADDLDNPFGTTLGAINAWKLVQRERLGVLTDE